jgi:dienelactone hydrolase
MRSILFLFFILITQLAQASDLAREKQWEDEILDSLVVGDAVYLDAGQHRFLGLYTAAQKPRGAVILVHGIGIHPDWGLIGVLRRRLADAGYTTLAIQMPVLAREATPEQYTQTFGDAAARLQSAVAYLKGKGQGRVAIVSHSLGSRMTNYYLTHATQPAVVTWVALSLPGPITQPEKLHLPIADIFGGGDMPVVLENRMQRKKVVDRTQGARQVVIPNADHFYTGRDDELFAAVRDALDGFFPLSDQAAVKKGD